MENVEETSSNTKTNLNNFCALKISEHMKPNYAKFRDWWLDSYASIGETLIPLIDKYNEKPLKISFQQVLFDAYMSRENEIQQLRQKISQLEKEKTK